MRAKPYIWSLVLSAIILPVAVCHGFDNITNGEDTALQPHVKTIERAIATRSLVTIRRYLHPQRTYVEILGKPASYLSVNQATAVIEAFLKDHILTGYSRDVIKESGTSGIVLGSVRSQSREGTRTLKLALTFGLDDRQWQIIRIVIR